jgi:hypothetical protein
MERLTRPPSHAAKLRRRWSPPGPFRFQTAKLTARHKEFFVNAYVNPGQRRTRDGDALPRGASMAVCKSRWS